jgi:hypothetical protein
VGDAGLDACAPEPVHKGAAIMIGSAPEDQLPAPEGSIACPQHAPVPSTRSLLAAGK